MPNGMPNTVHCIKQGNKNLSARDYADTSFVIGFQTATVARKVQYSIDPAAELQLVRAQSQDVSQEVNTGLHDLGVPTSHHVKDLVIDAQAHLVVPKYVPTENTDASAASALQDAGFHLHTVKTADFLMLPFAKHIGIVMPMMLVDETPDYFVFSCILVEPCFNAPMAITALAKLI
jgi:hypothetical protein